MRACSRVDEEAGAGGVPARAAAPAGERAAYSRVDALHVRSTYAVTYEHQELLIGKLQRLVDECWRPCPGFLGARVLRGLEGTRVVVESAWENRAAYEAMRVDSRVDAQQQVLARFAVAETALFEVAGERGR